MRIIAGGIMHETHTFSAEPTPLESFGIQRGDEIPAKLAGTNCSMGGVIDASQALGLDLVPTLLTNCVSTAAPSRETFETMLNELVERIRAALPADGVVLTLHGAMVAEGYDDAEGEIVRRVREVVGPDIPIAVTLDLHANIGQKMVDQATIVTTYDTYPHIDLNERAQEAVQLLVRTIKGEITPTMALAKPPLLPVPQAMFTAKPPFKTLLDRAHEMEENGEALTVTVSGGFPYADIPDAGVGFLVTTDNDPAKARELADELAEMAWSMREQMKVVNMPPDQAVAEAIAYPEGPVMLVDVGDNIGGGTPGDATVILQELIDQDAQNAVVVMADAAAVQKAIAAGVGNNVKLSVGGKTDMLHGGPVELQGRVKLISDGVWVHEGPENAGVTFDGGPSVVVIVGGIELIITTRKSMPGDQQQLKSFGIEPTKKHIIVVKSAVRWRGGFGPIAKHSIDVDTPGLGATDLSRFDFKKIRRPIYPLDPETTWERGTGD
jgi:microcystin degradation protein MlrC